ncbi:hypothetical protein KDAU_04960 [Dictyobacter aurantiacus]|uniref:Uncharacterized protein n=1 Tax=Dictyobacter aurantiacus TaxID=1936993 RepID=A0A401Z8H1_9CHLR|nr:hypothetical protein KDAU_04960 [Dictyobacter aurantiacus]
MPRFSAIQFFKDISFAFTTVNGKRKLAYIDIRDKTAVVCVFFLVIGGYTLLLLFISSLGGMPFEQTRVDIPELALIMFVLFVVGYTIARKSKKR